MIDAEAKGACIGEALLLGTTTIKAQQYTVRDHVTLGDNLPFITDITEAAMQLTNSP